MVQWSDDDGAAANEPDDDPGSRILGDQINELMALNSQKAARLAAQQEQIGRLMCRVEQLERENAALRESRDYWVDRLASLDVAADFPLNATKHSR